MLESPNIEFVFVMECINRCSYRDRNTDICTLKPEFLDDNLINQRCSKGIKKVTAFFDTIIKKEDNIHGIE